MRPVLTNVIRTALLAGGLFVAVLIGQLTQYTASHQRFQEMVAIEWKAQHPEQQLPVQAFIQYCLSEHPPKDEEEYYPRRTLAECGAHFDVMPLIQRIEREEAKSKALAWPLSIFDTTAH